MLKTTGGNFAVASSGPGFIHTTRFVLIVCRQPESPEHHGIGRPLVGNIRPLAEVVGQQPLLLFAGFARHEPVEQVVYLFDCHHRCLLISSIIRLLAFESVPRTDDSVIPVMAAISAKFISSTLRICNTVRQL